MLPYVLFSALYFAAYHVFCLINYKYIYKFTPGIAFKIAKSSTPVLRGGGWRYANTVDVLKSINKARTTMGKSSRWTIASLIDGVMKGAGYRYALMKLKNKKGKKPGHKMLISVPKGMPNTVKL